MQKMQKIWWEKKRMRGVKYLTDCLIYCQLTVLRVLYTGETRGEKLTEMKNSQKFIE